MANSESLDRLVYEKFGQNRFTQDSPILLSVFDAYFNRSEPDKRLDVLVTPDWSISSADLAQHLTFALDPTATSEAVRDSPTEWAIAHNPSVVAAKLTFAELIVHVLPLSYWFRDFVVRLDGVSAWDVIAQQNTLSVVHEQLLEGLRYLSSADALTSEDRDSNQPEARIPTDMERNWIFHRDFVWASRLFYVVENRTVDVAGQERAIADATVDQLSAMTEARARWLDARREAGFEPLPDTNWVFTVQLNREVKRTIHKSVKTTKADAVIRSFATLGEGIVWAVIDSGIDATHGAFRRDATKDAFDGVNTRIRATYDFSQIRNRLSVHQRRAVYANRSRMVEWERLDELEAEISMESERAPADVTDPSRSDGAPQWRFRIPHTDDAYRQPPSSHGTHVAGILGANWDPVFEEVDPVGPPLPRLAPADSRQGMCPAIELYDLRVFGDDETGDEFAVISALQFIRYLNQDHGSLEIHGANLSLAIAHDASSYACGQSPVCVESDNLVSSGVVVVAAAGNSGRSVYTTTAQEREEGYRTVSIADPGNAGSVITVGATHRSDPHTYGVSYFSSRGPTGDGRPKPDLVAPGEKIYSSVPGNRFERQDGTSQAAPHVSGAAALLMARHTELIGNPERVKQILMDTATDLGRERHYQGAGLVDVMRAIQRI